MLWKIKARAETRVSLPALPSILSPILFLHAEKIAHDFCRCGSCSESAGRGLESI